MKMQQQANDVKAIMPNFDLQQAIKDPKFMQLTSPEVGMTVEQAVWALHGKEIQEQAINAVAERAKVEAAKALSSGIRPRENGSGTAAVASRQDPYALMKSMTREQRLAYVKNLR